MKKKITRRDALTVIKKGLKSLFWYNVAGILGAIFKLILKEVSRKGRFEL